MLAGPALQALRRGYRKSRVIGVGQPGLWNLLKETLRVETVWDGGAGLWAPLFSPSGPLPEVLVERLSGVSLALVFSPKPNQDFLKRLGQAGVSEAFWAPSFPQNGQEPVRLLQAGHLQRLGFCYDPEPFYLTLDTAPDELSPVIPADQPLLTVAPGSGNPRKNWPLSHYYEVTRALAWEYGLHVVWLAGPAEAAWLPYLQGLAESQGHSLLVNRPLTEAARLLARTHLYIGGDSGITHLAAAAKARRVLTLFGPTNPKIWAPFGHQVEVLTEQRDPAPGIDARISGAASGLINLSIQEVMKAAARLLEESGILKRN